MPYYVAFGLVIRSCIELFGLEPLDTEDRGLSPRPDIIIEFGKVPEHLERSHAEKGFVQVGPDEVLITQPHNARFLIQRGKRVIIEPCECMSLSQVVLGLTGTCLGAVLQQRMNLTFHGGAVKKQGQGVVLLLGRRGSGKSTMTALLGRAGYDVSGDDLCAVERTEHGCSLLPGIPSIKLCSRSIGTLGYDPTGLRMVKTHCDKYLVPTKPMIRNELSAVDRIYILGWGDRLEIAPVPKKQAVLLLIKGTYRKWMIRKIMGESDLFRVCSHIAQSVPVYTFIRPKDPERIEESLNYVVEHLGPETGLQAPIYAQ